MVIKQSKDEELIMLKERLQSEKMSSSVASKYIILYNILYHLSKSDSDPIIRLYITSHLKQLVIEQYHDKNGHMGTEKTYDSIEGKHYWPHMYKKLYQHVNSCVIYQRRNLREVKAPLQETDAPPFPFAKLCLDVSGPYPRTLSGNKYISFVVWYSAWPEAFAAPGKSAEIVVHLVLDEIIPRHSIPLQLVTDNDTENISKVIKYTLEQMNISHVTISYYHPQGNSKVERFHRT